MELARRVSDWLALAGGALLLAMAVLVTASVLRRWLTSQGVPGDFELMQTGLALAVFAFMPLCQLRGGNLFVDTFTARLPARAVRVLDGLWSLVYAAAAGLIAVMMAVGATETLASGTRSMVLGLPLGWPIAVAALLALWLAWVVLLTALDALRARDPLSDAALGGLSFVVLLGLMALRMPIGLAMFAVGAVGYVLLNDVGTLLSWLKSTPYYLFSNYTLSVIPLFILMGALAERAGLSRALFAAADAVIGHRPGGVAMAAIGACTGFGAICGSSVATTATMGRAALPELRRLGYDEGLATGTLAIGGTLGILIPPSIILIVYAISTEQNISKLFMAALIPGLMAAAFYLAVIAWLVRRDPEAGPAGPKLTAAEARAALLGVWPVLLIAVVVVGGIYGGVFTPTEGAAVGVAAMLVLGAITRTLGRGGIADSLRQTAETTAMIFIVLLGAEMFNAFLAISELPIVASETIVEAGLPAYGVLVALLLLYIVLGGVMDELAMLLLTLPVFFPVVMSLDFGMDSEETAIWFGILVLVIVGIGLTAPPIGLNVFVMKAIAGPTPITTIYRGVLPFIASDLARLAVLILFPSLSLALVRLLS